MESVWYKRWAVTLLFLSVIGVADATYLTAEHYRDIDPVCVIGPVGGLFDGCGVVTGSTYAVLLGVPVAFAGALYYLAALILAVVLLRTHNHRITLLFSLLTGAGFLFSLWFVYLQLFVLHALCLYCIISALVTTLLFGCSLVLFIRTKQVSVSLPQE